MRLRHAQHEIEHKLVRPLEHHGPRAEHAPAYAIRHAGRHLLVLHFLRESAGFGKMMPRAIVRIGWLFRIHGLLPVQE